MFFLLFSTVIKFIIYFLFDFIYLFILFIYLFYFYLFIFYYLVLLLSLLFIFRPQPGARGVVHPPGRVQPKSAL